MGFLDTLKNLLSKNADKVDAAIDKVGDVVDSKTQGKYAQQVDKVQDAAKKAVDGTGQTQPTPPEAQPSPAPAQPPAAPPTPAPEQPPAAPPTP